MTRWFRINNKISNYAIQIEILTVWESASRTFNSVSIVQTSWLDQPPLLRGTSRSRQTWLLWFFFLCQSEAERSCGPTGSATWPRRSRWCSWWTRPASSSSQWPGSTFTSCWSPAASCLWWFWPTSRWAWRETLDCTLKQKMSHSSSSIINLMSRKCCSAGK